MNADDVRECLSLRWPDSEFLVVPEAPQDAQRQGRKIDLLAVSLWKSRGHELDAVEIKISSSDWRRELNLAAKADWWWRHCHRFWVAVPAELATKVREDLPPTWGLLSCTPGAKPKVVVKAPPHDPRAIPWSAAVGLMRASADAGSNALARAEQAGYQRGRQTGESAARAATSDGQAQRDLARLREAVEAFEATSGLTLTDGGGMYRHDAEIHGKAVAIVRAHRRASSDAVQLQTTAVRVSRALDEMNAAAAELRAAMGDET